MLEYKFEIEIYDVDNETVAWMNFEDDEYEAEQTFDKLSVGAGGSIALLKYNYRDDKYINTEVVKSKK